MAQRTSFATIIAGSLLMGGWLAGMSSGQTITTVAGGYTGDGGPATSAKLDWPSDVFVDGVGNVYIADYDNGLVRKVDAATGNITTVAGGGNTYDPPYGDGGAATEANVPNPEGVFVDGGGNIYIADPGTGRIRKVDGATGTITTVAGGGNQYSPPYGDGGPALDAVLYNPSDVFVDQADNIYIADRYHYQIRKVDAATGIITTVAGNGSNTYSGDGGLATAAGISFVGGVHVDGTGNIYLTYINAAVVRKVDTAGIITAVAGGGSAGWPTFGDGGSALDAQLQRPSSVAVDADGNIYIGEDYRVRKVDIGGIITTVAGGGSTFPGDGLLATQAQLGAGNSIYVDGAGNIYIGDKMNNRVCKVDAGTGIITTLAGGVYTGDGGPATSASFQSTSDVSIDGYGNIYIADANASRIRKVEAGTGVISAVAGGGSDSYSSNIPATSAALSSPQSVFAHSSGDIYLIDQGNRVRRVEAVTGNIATVAGGGNNYAFPHGDGGPATEAVLSQPSDLYVDGAGNIYIADTYNHRIRKVDASTGNIETIAGDGNPGYSGDGGPAISASLSQPVDVELDGTGNLFIADMGNRVVRKVDASGNISTVAGGGAADWPTYGDGGPATSAQLNWGCPRGLYVNAAGDLFIAEQYKIRKVSAATGIITTVAGSGQWGFGGDGGSALQARFNEVEDVEVVGGFMYIADSRNDRIRRVDLSPFISETSPATGLAGAATVYSGTEVKIFSIGLSGDGEASLNSVSLTIEDLSAPTGLNAGDFAQLKLYRSADAFLGQGDPQIGSASANVGSPTLIEVSIPEVLPLGMEQFYLVSAELAPGAGIGHAFRVGFEADGVNTSLGGRGTGFAAVDGDRVIIAPVPIITTVAGNGTAGSTGDGSFAVEAQLNQPNGQLVVDGSGNIYFSDEHSRIFRKVDGAGGLISRIAGQFDYWDDTGEGGLATDATFKNPHGIAVDSNGNLYLSDWNTSRVRKVDAATGIITTVAGDGTQGHSGDGGPGTSAQLMFPLGLCLDETNNNLYIADYPASVRKLDLSSGIITTVAGNGTQGFSGDGGPAIDAELQGVRSVGKDAAGNIYIADTNVQRIRKVDTAGIITTIAGGSWGYSGDGGPASQAALRNPAGLHVDAVGNIYIADSENHCIRKVDAATGIITTVAGNGTGGYNGDQLPATTGQLNRPQGVFVDGTGNIFITDADNYRVRKVVVSPASLVEITPAAGLSGVTIASRGHEAQLFSIGLSGNGTAGLTSITLTIEDLSNPTGISQSDFEELKLYRSADATLDAGDVAIGSAPQASINISSPTTVEANGPDTPPGVQWYYLVSAKIDPNAAGDHAFKVGFPSGGAATTVGSRGTGFAASDADQVVIAIPTLTETTAASGLAGALTSALGAEVRIFSVGMTGDGAENVSAVTLTLSDLSAPTGLDASDFSQLRVYSSTDAVLDHGDTEIGSVAQASINIGSPTLIPAAAPDIPPQGAERFYLVSAVLAPGGAIDHAFRVGFEADGVATSLRGRGTGFAASDADKVTLGPRPTYELPKTNQPPALDGVRSAGEWAKALVLESSPSKIAGEDWEFGANELVDGAFDGPGEGGTDADASSTTRIVWDDTALYFITEVRDNAHDVVNTGGPTAWWERDSISLYVDLTNANDEGQPYTSLNIINYVAAPQNSNAETITLEYTSGGSRVATQNPADINGLSYGYRDAGSEFGGTADYVIEGKIPWSALTPFNLPAAPANGTIMGLSIIALDPDGEDDWGGQIQCWGMADHPRTYADILFAYPSVTASEPTPAGDNVTSNLVDPETGSTAATLNFANVVSPGETTLQTTSEGPPPPAGFQVGDPPITYEIATTATFAGAVGVCIDYTGISFADESALKLFHFQDNAWADVTTSLDINEDLICGSVASLSPFGLFEQPAPPIAALTGSEEVLLGRQVQVSAEVLSGGDARVEQGTPQQSGLVTGSIRAAGDVRLGAYNHVTGEVNAGGVVQLPRKNSATVVVDGAINSNVTIDPVVLPPVQMQVDPAGAPRVKVKPRKTLDLAPGAYGVLEVGHHSTLTLHSGTYYFERFVIQQQAQLIVQLTNEDPLTVNIKKGLHFGHHTQVTIQGGDAAQVLFNISGGGLSSPDVGTEEVQEELEAGEAEVPMAGRIGHDAQFAGTIYAPQGAVRLGKKAVMEGGLVGRRVRLGNQAVFTGKLADHLDLSGSTAVAKSVVAEQVKPASFALLPNYPNPFNPETTIRFELPQVERVRLEVYSVLGQKVRTLIEGELPAGTHAVRWDGRDESGQAVSSGVYFYRLEAGAQHPAGRMLLLR